VAGQYALYLPIHIITALETEGFTDAEIGLFIRGVIKYHTGGTLPEIKDRSLSLLFQSCKPGFDYNIDKYEKKIKAQRENGKKGGAPKGNLNASKKDVKTTQNKPKQPKQADIELVVESDLDKKSSSKSKVVFEKQPTTTFLNFCINNQTAKKLCADIDSSWLSGAFTYPEFISEAISKNYSDKSQDQKTKLFIKIFSAEDRKVEFPQWRNKQKAAAINRETHNKLEAAKNNHPTKCKYCGGKDMRQFNDSFQCKKCSAISSFNKDKLKWEWRE